VNKSSHGCGWIYSQALSIGVAMHSGHPDYKTVLEAADKALYEAKHGGKNRVVLAAWPSLIGEYS
jgi:GGDEF domain-containing protein